MWLFLAFVAFPLIEIALFVTVGGAIGLWATLAIVVFTALLGTQLMRRQGMMTLARLQKALAEGNNPADPLAQGAMILVAGVLLLTPGFFTDSIGFLLLMPPVRFALIRWAATHVTTQGFAFSAGNTAQRENPMQNDVIDADYSVLEEPADAKPENPSGWTRP